MSFRKLGAAIVVILLMVVAAPRSVSAATITVFAVPELYQQSVQNPCIFSNPSCQQPAGFTATPLPTGGGVDGYDATVTYSLSSLSPYLNGGTVQIGLDINENNEPQTLELFEMYINGVLTDSFFFGGTGNVPAGSNGNGWADYLLSNFTSLAGLPSNTQITFHLVFDDANDGTENLFLVSGQNGTTPVPEPASMLLLGTGLLVAARARRRKKS